MPQLYWGIKDAGGICEMSEGESFVHEEIEDPGETRTWPNSQGKTEKNSGPGHMAPGDRHFQKVPIGLPEGCSCHVSPESPSPGTSVKYLY